MNIIFFDKKKSVQHVHSSRDNILLFSVRWWRNLTLAGALIDVLQI